MSTSFQLERGIALRGKVLPNSSYLSSPSPSLSHIKAISSTVLMSLPPIPSKTTKLTFCRIDSSIEIRAEVELLKLEVLDLLIFLRVETVRKERRENMRRVRSEEGEVNVE